MTASRVAPVSPLDNSPRVIELPDALAAQLDDIRTGVKLRATLRRVNGDSRMWRNWQTRWLQVPVPARACRFDSYHPHFLGS